MNFFSRLLDTSDYPARWNCGNWSPEQGWLHIGSDLAVWSAYVAIPCVLVFFLLRRHDLPFRKIFFLFGAFILACGTTHFLEALVFWWPAYRLVGIVKLMTAIVSWATVFALVPTIPRVLAMRSPEELQREIDARKKAEGALQLSFDELERRIEERTADLVQTNAALQLEHERFRITLASIGDAVITTDTTGMVTFMNPVAHALTGWNHEALGKDLSVVFQIVCEKQNVQLETPVARVLRERKIVGLENQTVLVARDGKRWFIDDSCAPIHDRQGNLVGCVLIFRDISHRRRLEKLTAERSAASRLLASIVEFSDDAIISKSLDGTIQSWNAGAQRVFGYLSEQVVGKPISLLIPKERLDEEERILAQIMAGQQVMPFDTVRVRNDGRLIDVSLTVSPIRDDDGRVVGASKIARDITHRKQMEAAIRKSEESLRLLTETIPSVVWTADPTGHITYINRRWLEYTGLSDEHNAREWFEVLHPEDYDRCMKQWAVALSGGTEYEIEVRNRRYDGVYRWFVTRAVPLIDRQGKVESWFGITTDIDDQKRAQQELLEAERRKDEFVATLAHELRGPLAPIRSSLEIIKRAMKNPSVLEEARGTMERQVNHMVRLIDDLLDISRISRGKLQLQCERLELGAVLAQAIETIQPHLDVAGHQLRIDLPSQHVYVQADSVRLAQVFSNLLHNACKYTDPGGQVDVLGELRGSEVLVTIRDNGVGIPAHHLPRLFEMFSQVDSARERSQGGLGIGLALVKGLLNSQGGTIQAFSKGLGQGSSFVVTMPVLIEEDNPRNFGSPETPPMHKYTILIADDNRDSANMLAKLLAITGHQVHTAYDGIDAVEQAAALHPDVVLLDLGMPRLDGFGAARQIRQNPHGSSILLIALTGWGDSQTRVETQEAGFDGHLTKPVDYQVLIQLIDKMRNAS